MAEVEGLAQSGELSPEEQLSCLGSTDLKQLP